jgi:hypothetical protein
MIVTSVQHLLKLLLAVHATRAVESVHKTSDSNSSIFKSLTPTPTSSYKLNMYYMIMVNLVKRKKVS